MLNRAMRADGASGVSVRAAWIYALAGTLGVLAPAALAQQDDEMPELTPEMRQQLEALMKQAQEAEGEQPEDEGQKQDQGEKPKVTAPGEKSQELSGEESIARFQSLLQRRPFHGPAFNGLVEDALKRNKLPDLIKEYQAKVAALPDQVALKIVLSRLQLRAGDAAGAGETLKGIERLPADLAKQNSELLVLKAEVYQRTGDNEGAERVLKEAQGLASSVSEQIRLGEALADLYLRAGKKDDAAAVLETLAAKFPENYLHQKAVATALTQRGLHESAVKRYREMLKLVGNEIDRKCEVLRELGNAQEKLGKRDEAIASYVEAIGLLASDHWLQKELHERVVTLYRASNKLDELAKYCEAQIKRAPEQTGMRVLLADVQGAMGKVEDGKQTLATAVELFPKDLALSTKRVEFLERAGDIGGASAEYQRTIGQHPQDTELMISYGQFLANNHQVDGARGQWRQVLCSKVDDPTLALRLGALFEAYELYDDAGEAYERAIAVQPKQADPYIALSRMWLLKGDQEKSAAALDRLGAASPNDATVQAALAGALRSLGKLDAALAAISKACEIAPDQAKYAAVKAELLISSGQLEQALAVRRSLVDKAQGAVQQAEAVSTLVSMYASAQKLDDLVKAEKERTSAKPDDVMAWLILAKAADTQRDFTTMRAALDAVLKVQPGHEQALTQLAKLQDATGDIDAAIGTYTQLIQMHPQRARQFYEAIVDVKVRSGDKAGAVTTLESMASADPTNVATQCAVAEQMVRMEEADRALPYFEKALRAQPDRHEARLDYGKALAGAGRYEEAAAAFKAVALQRTDMDRAQEALAKLHETCTQLGTLEELIDELHQQVQTDPQNTLVARALTQLLVSEFEYGRAMELLDMVLRHNARDVDLSLARAELLRRLAKFDEAIEGYQKVLRFPQIDRDYVLGELGKTQFESGQVEQARRLWKQIQHKMYAGTLLKNNGLLEDAVNVLEEGIRQKPDDYALHRNLVAALEAAGKTPEALAAARRLLDLEPGNVWNIEKLATAFLRSGDRAGAASVAARLFSAGVGEDKTQQNAGGYGSYSSAMQSAAYSQYYSSYYGYGYGQQAKSNLDRGVAFFMENGLIAELEEVLTKAIAAQPDNAVLKDKAADLLGSQLNKPELALQMLRELETAKYPVEHQAWLGKSSQRDHLRVEQYNLIARKPALRDAELSRLNAKKQEELTRDELLELAVIRQAEGNTDQAAQLLTRVVQADGNDTLALGVLTDLLVSGEKYKEAEPHGRKLVELLGAQRDGMRAGTIERVRREFVRTLPLELQLRVTEDLLADIADKWTLGAGWSWYGTGVQTPGYLRAKLTLGTILAETERMEEARGIWKELTPKRGPDVDRWTMLGDTAQLHKQEDLAYEFYQEGLKAAGKVAGDPLLQQVYLSSTAQRSWYGEEGAVDKAFSSIVEAFSKRDALVQLYDFLRDTDQEARARRVADEYKLYDKLKELYTKRFEDAAAAFKASSESPLKSSVAYFAAACKLAEVLDRSGDWDAAQKVYERYCTDFPDELGLLQTLGEVAQARQKMDEAIAWEKKVLECKTRLAKQAREWGMRDLAITPSRPQPLSSARNDYWNWSYRWSNSRYGYGYGSGGQLDRSTSWMRLAQLYLAEKNEIAAGDAMQRAVGEATGRRHELVRQVTELIQQRQLTGKMLPVLRTLAVYAPADERVQLAFADSLEAAGKKDLAVEVCNRMLRRGLSDLGTLAEVKRRINAMSPQSAAPEVTLASLEAESAAQPENLKTKLRLAKAYYYSLEVEKSAAILEQLAKDAPHLEGLHELLVEVYTLKGDSEKLVAALKLQIEKESDDRKKRVLRWRLVDELLTAGKDEEALTIVKEQGDPRDPASYVRIGTLLQYFGKYDEAVAMLQKAKSSQRRNPYGGDETNFAVAQAMALQGDFPGAAKKIMDAVAEQSKQQVQYGGVYGMYNDQAGSPFQALETVFALYPKLAEEVEKLVEERRAAAPTDANTVKLVMGLHRSLGRPDKADAMAEKQVDEGNADQGMVAKQIDAALARKDYDKAVALAEKFINNQPKQVTMPGMPAQYAAYAALQSPRAFMLCKLGDVYWDKGDKDKAFETYAKLIDPKIEETKTAYATICLVRGRTDEAKKLVEDALAVQKVKLPALLQFRAAIAALEGKPEAAFDAIAEAAKHQTGEQDPYSYRGGGDGTQMLAMMARKTGQLDKYAAFMREKIQKNPNDWSNYQSLITAYSEAGRHEDVMSVLAEAEKIPALLAQALATKVSLVKATAPLDELIASYEKLLELQEKDVSADGSMEHDYQGYRALLADLLWEKGEREKAVAKWLERANLQKPGTHVTLARQYEEKEAWDEAEKAFTRAVELDPDNILARTGLAELAYARADRMAMLPHMLEVFNKTGVQDPRDSRRNSYSYSGYNPYGADEEEEPAETTAPMTEWAAMLAADPAVMDYLEKEAGDKAGEYRVMLGALTGDWNMLEQALKPKIDAGTHDPQTWQLWAKVQQRKGDWKEAARALSYLKRSNQTTIAQYRDRLKLVLAGKQFKEAAAGTRQAQPGAGMTPTGPGANPYYSGYSSRYSSYWGGSGDDLLPSIYLKLGDRVKAERLYLVGGDGEGVEGKLPRLSMLMWDDGKQDRALELMRQAIVASDNSYGRNMITQYAAMVAESGKVQDAIDLLVRSYRWDSSADQSSMYEQMYAQRGGNEQLERGQGSMLGDSIFELLTRHGLYEATLKKLAEDSAKDPTDARLSQLVISLQKRGAKWADLKQALAGWQAAKPGDLAIKMEHFHACCQLGKHDEALALLEEIKKDAPARKERWALHEAFVHFLKDDAEKAIAVLEPVLAADVAETQEPEQAAMLLACLGKLEGVVSRMEKMHASGEIPPQSLSSLLKVYLAAGKKDEALALALDRFWKTEQVLSIDSPWYRAVCRLGAEGAKARSDRPADTALMVLATQGPKAGVQAFTALTSGETPSVEALRGLILAAGLAGDDALAQKTTSTLVAWLEPRRHTAWYKHDEPSLQQMARKMLDQASRMGTSQIAMAGAAGGQMWQGMEHSQGPQGVQTYGTLWQVYGGHACELLARMGKADELRTAMKAMQRRMEGGGYSDEYSYSYSYSYSSRYAGFGGIPYMRSSYSYRDPYDQQGGDWQSSVRSLLWQCGHAELTHQAYATLAARTPQEEWGTAGAAAAAIGKGEDAAAWRSKLANALFASLLSADTPDLGSSTRDPWRWYYGSSNAAQELWRIRAALRTPVWDEEEPPAIPVRGEVDQLWELALLDPAVAARFEALEQSVGQGWGGTRTFQQLLAYAMARKDAAKVIALIEKAYEPDKIISSEQLTYYVWACYKTKAFDKLEAVLAKAEKSSSTMKNDVDLARLVMLRKLGKAAEADALEQKLLAQCVKERPNTRRLKPELTMNIDGEDGRQARRAWMSYGSSAMMYRYGGYQYNYNYGRYYGGGMYDAPTIPVLANLIGVRFDARVREEDLTLDELRSAYYSHGLWTDAARLFDKEMAEETDPKAKEHLLASKAYALHRAGKKAEAHQTAAAQEQLLLAQIKERPADASLRSQLADLYMSKQYGEDYAKALDAVMTARRLDPTCDQNGAIAVHCLYKLNRHAEALEAWRAAQRVAGEEAYDAPTIYYAALAAGKAGDKALGERLARQALYTNPGDKLAAEAQGLIK